MRRVLYFLLLLFLSVPVFAQNWRTVNPHDTVYFKCIATNNYGALRMVYVDSIKISNGDSACYFYKTMRAESNSITSCVDTNAPSWMGVCCLRKTDGTELYFNELHDTILMRTQASVADSWIMAKDTSGDIFYATVLAADTTTIDGVLDSVKTCSIQAVNAGSPVSNYYNAFIIKWSKNHGWLTTLDWYAFPNTIAQPYRWGAQLMPFSFERLPKTFNGKDFSQPDLLWKYAPGNEWFCDEDVTPIYSLAPWIDKAYTYDSVISRTTVNSNTVLAVLKEIRRTVKHKFINNQVVVDSDYTTTFVRADTVTVSSYDSVRTHVFPDLKPQTIGMKLNIYDYTVDTFCVGRDLLSDQYSEMVVYPYGTCIVVAVPGANSYWGNHTYLDGFGIISERQYWYSGAGTNERKMAYTYLKLGNCVIGDKASSTVWLGVNEAAVSSKSISVFPNPAHDNVTITVPETSDVSLLDMAGRLMVTVRLSKGSNQISVADLPAGLYILRVSDGEGVYTQKLIVQNN